MRRCDRHTPPIHQPMMPTNAVLHQNQHHHHHPHPHAHSHHHQQHVGIGFIRQGMQDNDFPLRMLVQADMVGAIIGRSGSTIKSITQLTKARIDVHREEGPEQPEKAITINGSPDCCSEACFRIIEIIQNEKLQCSNNNLTNNSTSAKHDTNNAKQSFDIQLKILAHSNLIGRLIGRSGSSIKKIMEQTSTKINISVNSLTETTGEHSIVVVGSLKHVRQAEKMISAKLRTAYISDVNSTIQTMNQQPYLFNNVPLPYIPGPYTQNPILSSIVSSHTSHSNAMSRTMPIASHQGQITGPIYTSTGSPNYMPLYPNMNVQPTGPGLLGFNPVVPGFEYERETVNIYIPNTMVGAIIGKSGVAIKEMISTSGASIRVTTAPTVSELNHSNQQPTKASNESTILTENRKPDQQSRDEESQKEGSHNDETTNTDSQQPQQHQQSQEPTSPPKTVGTQRQPNSSNDQIEQSQTRKVTIVGYPASQYSAQYMIYQKVSMESDSKSDISLMVEIQVPSHLVGRIIGKGGATVKQLQKQTRTTIRLPDDKSGLSQTDGEGEQQETCVQITGEFAGSQAAQRHIRNLIRESQYGRQTKSHQGNRNNEGSTSKNNNPQSNFVANNQHRSDNESVSTTPGDANNVQPSTETITTSTIEKGTDDKSFNDSNDNNPPSTESPSCSCDTDRPQQEDKSQLPSQSQPAGNGESTYEGSPASNNNTTINNNNNLNSNERSISERSTIKTKDHIDLKKNDNCQLENGESIVDSTSSVSKQKPALETKTEPALVNNGNQK